MYIVLKGAVGLFVPAEMTETFHDRFVNEKINAFNIEAESQDAYHILEDDAEKKEAVKQKILATLEQNLADSILADKLTHTTTAEVERKQLVHIHTLEAGTQKRPLGTGSAHRQL